MTSVIWAIAQLIFVRFVWQLILVIDNLIWWHVHISKTSFCELNGLELLAHCCSACAESAWLFCAAYRSSPAFMRALHWTTIMTEMRSRGGFGGVSLSLFFFFEKKKNGEKRGRLSGESGTRRWRKEGEKKKGKEQEEKREGGHTHFFWSFFQSLTQDALAVLQRATVSAMPWSPALWRQEGRLQWIVKIKEFSHFLLLVSYQFASFFSREPGPTRGPW